MLHYSLQPPPVHEPGAGGQPLSHVDADGGSQADYSHWLHMSSPTEHMAPVQPAPSQQGFVQDAYSVPPPAYYTQAHEQGPALPSPTTPVDAAQYGGQDGYGFFLYPAQVQTPQQQQQHETVYSFDGQQQQPGTGHMLSSPSTSFDADAYGMFSQFATPPEQSMQMPIFASSSPIDRQPQPAPSPQPPVLSTPRPRGYPHSANPLRPSRLRQVSNYDDDVPEPSEVPDHDAQTTSFDERLSSVSLVDVNQQAQSLAFALASPVKFNQPVASSSANSMSVSQASSSMASGEPAQLQAAMDALPPPASVVSNQNSESLYDALFNSAGTTAPIATAFDAHAQESVTLLDNAWSQQQQQQDTTMTSMTLDTSVSDSSMAPTSTISALAGAVLDEFDVRSPEKATTDALPVVLNDIDADFDIDHDADGETEPSATPMFAERASPGDTSGNNNSNGTMLTGSTLVDEDQFFWQDEQAKAKAIFGTTAQMEAELQAKMEPMELTEDMLKVANEILASSPPLPAPEPIPEIPAAEPRNPELAHSSPVQSTPLAKSEEERLALQALAALSTPRTHGRVQAAFSTPVGTIPPSAPSSASVPLAATAAARRGGKRKRGSATSSPARSRIQSPMPATASARATPIPPRRRFPATPIAFHVGPTDDTDPRNRYRTRSKLPGIDVDMDEKEKDHDLFIIRGGVFDHIPNGSRIKQAATRTRAARGSENAGLRSATASRAASVATGSSPAPGAAGSSRVNTRGKKARTAAMVDVKTVVQPLALLPAPEPAPAPAFAPPPLERPKRELPKRGAAPADLKPLYTNAPQERPAIATNVSPASSSLTPSPVQTQSQPSTSTSTFSIQPISVQSFPARTHASLEYHAPPVQIQPLPAPKRSPTRRAPAAKAPKKRKRAAQADADEEIHALLDELEEDDDSDFIGPSTSRAPPPPPAKRPRRNLPIAPVVPPRNAPALPPIGTSFAPQPPAPATPVDSPKSWNSPLTPLSELPSSSPPPAPPAAVAHPPVHHTAIAPAPPMHPFPPAISEHTRQAVSPTTSTTASTKRGPRRQPALPQFSNSTPRAAMLPVPTGPQLSPVASSSATTLDGTVPAIAPDDHFPMLHPADSIMTPEFRSFPPEMEIRAEFALWYRRFPLVGVFRPWDPMGDAVLGSTARPKGPAGATFNNPTTVYDLYTPRYVKGTGREKQGMCPICAEPPERGGEGKQYWFAMKVSAFNYHMQNAHGVSASLKLPFSPPIEFRSAKRTVSGRHEKDAVLEGKCHQCLRFIPLEGVKVGDIKVKEIYWWKHVAKCHQTTYAGECDLYYEDEVLARVKAFEERERQAALRNAIDRSVGVPPRMVAAPGYPAGYLMQVAPNSGYGHSVPISTMNQLSYGQAALQMQYPMAAVPASGPIAGPSGMQHMSPISPMAMYPGQHQHPHHMSGAPMLTAPPQVAPMQHSHMTGAPTAHAPPPMSADTQAGYMQAASAAVAALPPPLHLPQQPME